MFLNKVYKWKTEKGTENGEWGLSGIAVRRVVVVC